VGKGVSVHVPYYQYPCSSSKTKNEKHLMKLMLTGSTYDE